MSEVVIRLKRLGRKKRPHNRIVVMAKAQARDDRQKGGFVNPRDLENGEGGGSGQNV